MSCKNTVKKILFKTPESFRRKFYYIYNELKYPEMRETRKSFGEKNPDKTFFVIRPRTDCVEGLMALMLSVVKLIDYAITRNYIPIIDFENYKTQYYDSNINIKNVWEYYFLPLNEYKLEDVYSSKNVILSGLNSLTGASPLIGQFFNSESLEYTRKIVSKYIRLSESASKFVLEEKNRAEYKNAIGLYMRGTDYIKLKPAGHPIQPTVDQAVVVVNKFLSKNKEEKIFLVTEDQEIFDSLKSIYQDKIITVSYDSYIANYDGKNFISKENSAINMIDESPYKRGLKYLCKLILLSKCNTLIAGNTCGSWFSCVMATKFEDMYIFDLGNY